MGYTAQTIRSEPVIIPGARIGSLRAALHEASPLSWVGPVEAANEPNRVYAEYGFTVEPLEEFEPETDDRTGFVLTGWDGEKLGPDFDEMCELAARHARPQRADWVMVGEDGCVWMLRFEQGACTELGVEFRAL